MKKCRSLGRCYDRSIFWMLWNLAHWLLFMTNENRRCSLDPGPEVYRTQSEAGMQLECPRALNFASWVVKPWQWAPKSASKGPCRTSPCWLSRKNHLACHLSFPFWTRSLTTLGFWGLFRFEQPNKFCPLLHADNNQTFCVLGYCRAGDSRCQAGESCPVNIVLLALWASGFTLSCTLGRLRWNGLSAPTCAGAREVRACWCHHGAI